MMPLHWQTVFPIWDKAQWIPHNEGSQSGFAITFRLGNHMPPGFCWFGFFFSPNLFRSSTRQQMKLYQVENMKEMLCSSGTKFTFLAGSRGSYGE